ncbi:unnamed protein product, partial [Aphanomyces euteiches]
ETFWPSLWIYQVELVDTWVSPPLPDSQEVFLLVHFKLYLAMRLTAASVLALIALTAASRSSVDGREPAAPIVEVGDVTRRLAKDPPRMRTMSAYKTQSKDKPILRPED